MTTSRRNSSTPLLLDRRHASQVTTSNNDNVLEHPDIPSPYNHNPQRTTISLKPIDAQATQSKMASSILPSPSRRRFITGILLLLCVVVLWTTSSFITSDLLEGGYEKPFLITYLNTSAFSLYLIPFLLKRWNTARRRRRQDHSRYSSLAQEEDDEVEVEDEIIDRPLPPPRPTSTTGGIIRSNSLIRSLSPSPALITHPNPQHHNIGGGQTRLAPAGSTIPEGRAIAGRASFGTATTTDDYALDFDAEHDHDLAGTPVPLSYLSTAGGESERLTSAETARLAATFCIVWFAANWTVNASLGLTSVGSSTVLAGMSGFFTLALGRMLGVETFTRAKVLAVLASFFGLLLVTHSDSLLASVHASSTSDTSPHTKNPMLGDVLALLSAFCYAVYVILLKVRIGDEERVDMQLFFGFVGLFNTIFLLPLIPILSVMGIETFEFPSKKADLIVCAINMAITLSSDYLYVLAMLKTTPLVVTIGLSLTIPFAMLGDFLRGYTAALTSQAILGAVLVIVGFGLMGLEGLEEGVIVPTTTGEINGSPTARIRDNQVGDLERGRPGSRSMDTDGE